MNEERWILVGDGTSQVTWLGKTQLSDFEIEQAAVTGGYLLLNECRVLRTLLIPNPSGGVVMQNQLTPVGICRGAATVRVKPTHYLWPDEDEATMGPLREQIRLCSQAEIKARANEAGLVVPDGMRVKGGNAT